MIIVISCILAFREELDEMFWTLFEHPAENATFIFFTT
jgi:hypothetical protein